MWCDENLYCRPLLAWWHDGNGSSSPPTFDPRSQMITDGDPHGVGLAYWDVWLNHSCDLEWYGVNLFCTCFLGLLQFAAHPKCRKMCFYKAKQKTRSKRHVQFFKKRHPVIQKLNMKRGFRKRGVIISRPGSWQEVVAYKTASSLNAIPDDDKFKSQETSDVPPERRQEDSHI